MYDLSSMFMRVINHVIAGREKKTRVEDRVISKFDSFLYTSGIIYYTGICYERNTYMLHCVVCLISVVYLDILFTDASISTIPVIILGDFNIHFNDEPKSYRLRNMLK